MRSKPLFSGLAILFLITACIGQNPCEDVTCDTICRGVTLWKQKCVNGECVPDSVLEENSQECGFTPPERDTAAEEYAVYDALISDWDLIATFHSFEEVEVVVIEDHTSAELFFGGGIEEILERIKEGMPLTEQETLDDFLKKNEQPHRLEDLFDLPVTVVLLSNEEFKEIFQNGSGWEDFYKKYPRSQGIMMLSRVGFNSKMDQALVYVGNQSHWLSGAGYYVLLTKAYGFWTVQSEMMVWIS